MQTPAGITLELSDLHGDVVGEMPNSPSTTAPATFPGTDEFGVPRPGTGTGSSTAISVVGTGVKTLTSAATSMTISKPAGTTTNDLLIAQIAAGTTATITPPSGWTAVSGGEVTSGTTRYKLFFKVAGSSESGSYAFSFSQSDKHVGAVTTLRNADTSTPIDTAATNSGSSVDITAPSVTPSVNGAGHLVFAGRDSGDSNGGSILSFASPLSEEWERKTGTTGSDRSAGAGLHIIVSGAGIATGSSTITNETAHGSGAWGAVTLAMRPSSMASARNQSAYGFLGTKLRTTSLASGAIEMGARVYVPQVGRFLQVDPVYGGSANNYDYSGQDPVNGLDLDGQICVSVSCVKTGLGSAVRFGWEHKIEIATTFVPVAGVAYRGYRVARLAERAYAAGSRGNWVNSGIRTSKVTSHVAGRIFTRRIRTNGVSRGGSPMISAGSRTWRAPSRGGTSNFEIGKKGRHDHMNWHLNHRR